MIDIHTHILPGVDDGSTSVKMTKAMLRIAKEAGIHTIVATPHFRQRNLDTRQVMSAMKSIMPFARYYGIGIYLGYEVHYSMLADISLRALANWCIGDTNALLLEFSNDVLPANWDCLLTDIVHAGYLPIIAHPERYRFIQKQPELAAEMKGYGCELQLDARALCGNNAFWNAEWRTAKKLLNSGLVDYIASDAHKPDHYRDFMTAHKKLSTQWPQKGRLNDWSRQPVYGT